MRRIGMLLVWAALLVVVQSNLPHADVAHSQTDNTLPELDRAQVTGTSLILYYNEDLDEDSTPAVTDFAVTADGSTIVVTGITREREIVGLTLTSPVYEGQTVLVSYTPGTNRIQDTSGNEAAAFTNVAVNNFALPRPMPPPTDNTPPQVSEDEDEGVSVLGAELILVYNEELDLNSNPDTTDYTVSTDGESVTVVSVTVSARFVTLHLAVATYKGENVVLSYTPGTNPVRDTSGNPAGALGEVAVVNLSDPEPPPDNMMPPLLTSRSYVEDVDLYLVYNELLAEGSVPPASAYTIRIDGTAVAIEEGNDGVTVHQMHVRIVLAQVASQGQTVTVSYTPPPEDPVQDLAGDQAAALDNVEVHNLLDGPLPPPPDTTPPSVSEGSARGTTLRLTYTEDLYEESVPATTAYTVLNGVRPNPVVDVDIDGNQVTLTVSYIMSTGLIVNVSYVVPEDDPVQDTSGNKAGALSNYLVTPVEVPAPPPPPPPPADRTPPALDGIPSVFEDTLYIKYDEALDRTSTPATDAYGVTFNGTAVAVDDVEIRQSFVLLSLESEVSAGQTVRVSYTAPGDDPVQDASGNPAGSLLNYRVNIVDDEPDVPDVLHRTRHSLFERHLNIYYNRALKIVDPPESPFTVTVDGEAVDFDVSVDAAGDVAAPGDSNAYLAVNLEVEPAIGATIVVTYTKPSNTALRIQDTDGNEAAAFTVTVIRPNKPPVFAEDHDPGRRSFTETVGDAVVATAENIGRRTWTYDPDREHSLVLVYTLYGVDAENFTIDRGTGQIRTKVGERYDRETNPTYLVGVKATDPLGAGATYTYIITVLDAAEPPLAPAAPVVTATAGSLTSLDVSWSAPSNAGRPDIETYDLQYGPGMDGPWTDGPQGVTGTSASIGSLMPGPPYYVRVRATNADGDGDWSPPGSGTTNRPPNLVPAFAADSAARSFTETVGDAAVTTPSNLGAPFVATDFDDDPLTYSLEGADAARFTIVPGSGQLRTKAGERYDREAKASYAVRVKAEDGNGGEAAIEVTITVDDATEAPVAPGVPLVEGGVGDRPNVYVTWTAPANAGRPAITGYDVQYRPGMNGPWMAGPEGVTGDVAVIRSLMPRTRYYARVRAKNADGDGAWSPPGSGRTNALSDGLPPPANLQPAVGDRRVTVTWDAPPAITGYQYRVSSDDGASWNPDWTNIPGSDARTTSFTVMNLANSFEHVIEVRALEDDVKPSGASRVTAAPMGPPSVPLMPETLEMITRDRALYVSWYKPEEDPRAPVTSYKAQYRPYGSSGAWSDLPVTGAHDIPWKLYYYQLIEGLDNRRPYEVQVAAVNGVGRGPWATATGVPQAEYRSGPPSDGGDEELDLGPLNASWTDRLNSVTFHPDTKVPLGNVIENSCLAPATFRVFWGVQGKSAEEYETDIQTRYGAGEFTHRVGAETVSGSGRTAAREQGYIYGTANLHRDSRLSVRVRARFDPEGWSTWSEPADLHCFETENPATSQQQAGSDQQAEAENSPATGKPAITGGAEVGETLAASTAAIDDANGLTSDTFSYQWSRDDGSATTDISDATTSTYTLQEEDLDRQVSVTVSFTDDAGYQEMLTSDSVYVQPPSPLYGGFDSTTLPGEHDGSNTFTFEIHFSEEPALGFEAVREYVLDVTNGDVTSVRRTTQGSNIRWEITVQPDGNDEVTLVLPITTDCDDQGAVCTSSEKMLSNKSSVAIAGPPETAQQVQPENSPATSAPTIGGSAQVGETLTADTSGIADADGLTNATFSFQWVSSDGTTDSDIPGETGATYVVQPGDVSRMIKVRVSFIDDAGNEETTTSAATGAVAAAPPTNNEATGAPAISGTVKVGHVLTADITGIADQDGLDNADFDYQWLAEDSPIPGATASAYLLVAADKGRAITVKVSFTDDGDSDESLTSAATAAVTTSPLTVRLENEPTDHDGSNTFTFQLRFSEGFYVSYLTLRGDAFTVDGGEVTQARRLESDSITPNVRWEITVRPAGDGDVTITLPETTDCDAAGAICTEDDRALSNRLEFTVTGPGG